MQLLRSSKTIAGTADSTSARCTRALVRLTPASWQPDCSFDTAVGLICETAAEALPVDRVDAGGYDALHNALRCVPTNHDATDAARGLL